MTQRKKKVITYKKSYENFDVIITVIERYSNYNWKGLIVFNETNAKHIVQTLSGSGGTYDTKEKVFELIDSIKREFCKYGDDKEFIELEKEYYE